MRKPLREIKYFAQKNAGYNFGKINNTKRTSRRTLSIMRSVLNVEREQQEFLERSSIAQNIIVMPNGRIKIN